MNLLCRPLVSLLLLCLFSGLAASELNGQVEKKRQEFSSAAQPDWGPWSGEILRRDGHSPEKVAGKKAAWRFTCPSFLPGEFTIVPVTAFVTESGNIWVGHEQSFYLETDSGVVGIRTRSRAVEWADSLVAKQENKPALGEILCRLQSTVTANEICRGVKAGTNGNEPHNRFTGLGMLQHVYFCPNAVDELVIAFGTIAGLHTVNVVAVRVEGGDLRMELRDGKYPGIKIPLGRYSAALWIDIKTRKVTKAIENGKQVFPKE